MNTVTVLIRNIGRLPAMFLLLFAALVAVPSALKAQTTCNDMQFTDVTASAGINYEFVWPPTNNSSTVGGATAVDVNGDGWLDLYAGQGDAGPNLLYINDQNGGFTEQAASRGAQLTGLYTTGASAADFDNDGDIDIGVSHYYSSPTVLVNDGNGFFTVKTLLWPNQRTFSSAWGDVDNDGLLELAMGQWMSRNETGPQGFYMYKNNGGGNLAQYEFRTNPQDDHHVFAPRFADLNGDRLSDIHLVADYGASRVFMNVGGGMFTESAGFGGQNDMGHAIGDYDKDGDLDIFTTDIETNAGNTLWKNDGLGNFTNVSAAAGIAAGGWAWAGTFGDLDLDGDLDIYHVNGFVGDGDIWKDNPNPLFMNNNDGTFTDVSECSGAGIALGSQGRGMHMWDYDNDGDLDIFVVNNRYMEKGKAGTNGIPVLLRNDTPANGKHWLKVILAGTPPMHRNGIGSRVYVKTGSITQMHELHASTNFLSQDAGHIAHFGLNTTSVADEVKAEWVTGDATVLTSVSGDQQISIPSPKATVSTRTPAIGQNVTATSNESSPVEWQIGGNTFADPVTTSFSSGGPKDLTLLVYNATMTQVLRKELIRISVDGAAGEPDIATPANGSILPSTDVIFTWNDNGASVDSWQLLAGTGVGGNDLYDSGALAATTMSVIASGLPSDGSTVHVTLRWTDGGNVSEKYFAYTAWSGGAGANNAPTVVAATGDHAYSQGDTVSLDVSAAFDDPDGDTLTYAATGLPASLSVDAAAGIITGDLTNDDAIAGPGYTIVVTATEVGTAELYSASDSFTITVNNVNDAPTVTSPTGNQVFDEGDSVNLDTSDAFTDVDGNALRYSATGLPASLSMNTDTGVVTGTLTGADVAAGPAYSVVVTATEVGTADSFTAEDNFGLTVTGAMDTMAPVITLIGVATVTITVGDSYADDGATAMDDVDGDITADIVVSNPVNTAMAGTYTVRYNVSDSAGNSAPEVTRTVVVNSPPVVTPPPPPAGTSGGGGAFSLAFVLLLGGLAVRLRARRRASRFL